IIMTLSWKVIPMEFKRRLTAIIALALVACFLVGTVVAAHAEVSGRMPTASSGGKATLTLSREGAKPAEPGPGGSTSQAADGSDQLTNTPTGVRTNTPTLTRTATRTRTPTGTATSTATSTATNTRTPTCGSGSDYVITQATGVSLVPGTSLVAGSQCDDCTVNIAMPFTYN